MTESTRQSRENPQDQTLSLKKADEQEWCLSHDIFLLARALTEDEKKQLYDPAKDQIPNLAQVRKRLLWSSPKIK